ncbi:hypothetical protein MG293_000886 [Ovis ammon polii]|uniref:Uncharacterized protein n=1 Tax=Ovis ammon polii TaxID=230172 RepID=A0AAD4UM32_OVIAM|nr:hypothetical protein MG293_000886 [Ovis ammon polii]
MSDSCDTMDCSLPGSSVHGIFQAIYETDRGFPSGSDGKESTCNAGDLGSSHGSGRSPGEGNGNPLQYPYLENPVDGVAWRTIVHGVAESHATE